MYYIKLWSYKGQISIKLISDQNLSNTRGTCAWLCCTITFSKCEFSKTKVAYTEMTCKYIFTRAFNAKATVLWQLFFERALIASEEVCFGISSTFIYCIVYFKNCLNCSSLSFLLKIVLLHFFLTRTCNLCPYTIFV